LKKADIVISHNSHYGIRDKKDLINEGYKGLLNYIDKNKPKYCVHSHQHKNIITKYKNTLVIGIYEGIILNTETNKIEKILEVE